jgi:plasmid maintenance system antidote protein VapI
MSRSVASARSWLASAITADTDLRLCRFFGLSDGWWLRLQADHDTRLAKGALAKTLARIKP